MNMKTILGVAAVAVGGSLFLGRNKINEYRNLADSLEFDITSVKGVKLQGANVVFDVDIKITNPTNVAVNVPGDLLLVKTLHFYTPSGKKIGVAHPNISNIQMPANGSREITNIPAQVSLSSVGNSFSEVIGIVSDPNQLRIGADLQAFGKSFTVNA